MRDDFDRTEDIVMAMASQAHDTWVGWINYMFSQCTFLEDGSAVIPAELVTRWKRQSETSFWNLPGNERDSDYLAAAKYFFVIGDKFNDVYRAIVRGQAWLTGLEARNAK